jgi:divalent metal cation (Fe/Co/Zn/Cd) transporter
MEASHAASVRSGIRIERLSIAWMVVEMAAAILAGIYAHSFLLVAFGLDSLIELVSAGILLWRLEVEKNSAESHQNMEQVEWAERRAAWVVAVSLSLLCLYVLASALFGLLTRSGSESSILGIAVSAAAVILMPILAFSKRRIARRIDSSALAGDAVNSFTCAYMAAAVLLGLVLQTIFGWWWAQDVASLLFLAWLAHETREAFEEARGRED